MGKITYWQRYTARSVGGFAGTALSGMAIMLAGCSGVQAISTTPPPNPISSVIPSTTGTPNSVTTFGGFAFVSVQGAGLIATYMLGSKSQTPAATYTTPCMDPSGMVATTINGANILAAVCFDSGSLITLTINADGSLQALGTLNNLPKPYPGIALDGTDVYVPLFGGGTADGTVAKISLASPAAPVLTGSVTLASPVPGAHVNAVALAVSGGYVYVAEGSEDQPQSSTSSVQVVNESSMALMGTPFIVPHSPQRVAISGGVAWVTLYDATELEAIDISNPAALKPIALQSLAKCHPIPIAFVQNTAYVGCYEEGSIARFNVANPAQMQPMTAIAGIASAQAMALSGNLLLVAGASPGGALYTVNLSELN